MKKPAAAEVLPTTPGTPFAGGIYLGRFFVGAEAFALIAAPKKEGELKRTKWSEDLAKVEGALEVYDGLANTGAMAAAGSKLAKWTEKLDIGGFKDWYLPSRGELLLAYAAEMPKAEAFEKDVYWSSTQAAGAESYAWCQGFSSGLQLSIRKYGQLRARAVRRLKV